MTQETKSLPFGLKRFRVFENQTHWNQVITAKTKEQARDKAWEQFWSKLPFTHCRKESFEVREQEEKQIVDFIYEVMVNEKRDHGE